MPTIKSIHQKLLQRREKAAVGNTALRDRLATDLFGGEHRRLPLRTIGFSLLGAFVALALFATVSLHNNSFDGVVTGGGDSLAPHRSVQNFRCSGDCSDIVVVDTSYRDVRYFGDSPICTEANIWANKTNDGRVLINGYVFVNGVQQSLTTVILDEDVLDGQPIQYAFPFSDSIFDVSLRNKGDLNLLQSLTPRGEAVASDNGFGVFTDYQDGSRATLFDSCSAAAKSTVIYSLYSQPELHGPESDDTFLVSLVRVDLPSTGSTTGSTGIFERRYSSAEFSDDVEHLTIPVSGTTLDFDLVKDGE